MRGLNWETPQGEKTVRAGDHQAMQTMYVVEVRRASSTSSAQVRREEAIGPDTCTALLTRMSAALAYATAPFARADVHR